MCARDLAERLARWLQQPTQQLVTHNALVDSFCMDMMHLQSLPVSRLLNGRQRTATFTLADMIIYIVLHICGIHGCRNY
jgi:hypothetical protein